MPAFHLLAVIELVCIFLFYDQILSPLHSRRHWLVLLLLLNMIYLLLWGNLYVFNPIAWSMNTVVFIFLGFAYYYQLYQKGDGIQIEKDPLFFINASFLIYASGSFFTYLFGKEILGGERTDFFHNAWIIQSIASLVKNLILVYGLWLYKYT